MLPGFDTNFSFDEVSTQLRDIADRCMQQLAPTGKPSLIPPDQIVSGGGVYFVSEGALRICDRDTVLLTVEEGECIVLPPAPLLLRTPDFAVRVYEVSRSVLESDLALALELKSFFADLWINVTATVVRTTGELLPRSQRYLAGATIIEQGTTGNDVYTLVDGEAEVFVDGVLVGEIQQNEFFGVIATVTKTPRTASVVAKTECSVLAVHKDRFHELISARPVIVEKLITELGRTIVDLNSRVVKMTRAVSDAR